MITKLLKEHPKPIIYSIQALGAIGGMMMGGIIGLFIGAVLLAFTYKIFQAIVQGS